MFVGLVVNCTHAMIEFQQNNSLIHQFSTFGNLDWLNNTWTQTLWTATALQKTCGSIINRKQTVCFILVILTVWGSACSCLSTHFTFLISLQLSFDRWSDVTKIQLGAFMFHRRAADFMWPPCSEPLFTSAAKNYEKRKQEKICCTFIFWQFYLTNLPVKNSWIPELNHHFLLRRRLVMFCCHVKQETFNIHSQTRCWASFNLHENMQCCASSGERHQAGSLYKYHLS